MEQRKEEGRKEGHQGRTSREDVKKGSRKNVKEGCQERVVKEGCQGRMSRKGVKEGCHGCQGWKEGEGRQKGRKEGR